MYQIKFLRDNELNIFVAWEGWVEVYEAVWDKETNNLESITILPGNHTKSSLNNLVIIEMRMKEKTLRIKEVIRFIKRLEEVNQTIFKAKESVVDDYTIDDYKY